jgi:tetratricopeptide (TPR) repeat protein
MSALKRLLDAIQGRSLWQVLGIYLAVGWLGLQVTDQLIQQAILPAWVYRSLLVVLVSGLPVVLTTAILQRDLRSQEGETAGVLRRVFTWRNARLGGAGVFGFLSLAALGHVSSRALGVGPAATLIAKGVLAEREGVIVADFAGEAQDAPLAAAVTEAIRTDLAQSPALAIMDRAAVADALTRMQRPRTSALTADVAREIAQRDGIKGVITGSINRVGPGFVLTGDLLLAQTGESVIATRENAADSSEIIGAIDRLSRRLRERIGESLHAMRSNQPLDQITTQSLEALELYSRARAAQFLEGDDVRSIALLEEVIRIDSTFAMAYDGLASAYWNAGILSPEFYEASEKAYRFRDQASRRERYLIEGNYQLRALRAPEKAVTAYRAALELSPSDREVLYNLGEAYGRLHDYARQEAFTRQAMTAGSAPALVELVEPLANQGKLAEAKAALDTADARLPPNLDVDLRRFYLASLAGQYQQADRYLIENRASRPEQLWSWQASLHWLELSALVRGRVNEAARLWQEGAKLSGDAEDDHLREPLKIAFARSWILQDVSGANRIIESVLRSNGGASFARDPRLAAFYVVNGQPDLARPAAAQVTDRPTWFYRHPWEMAPQAWIALGDRSYEEAIDLWRKETDSGPCPVCSMWLMGIAYDRANMPDSALVIYERYLATPWLRKIVPTRTPNHSC